jgi:hypothetical protein
LERPRRAGSQIAHIKAFAPDAVIGTQHSGDASQGRPLDDPDRDKGEPCDLFLDVLELPAVL